MYPLHTLHQLREPSQTAATFPKSSQFLCKVSEQKVSDGGDTTVTIVLLLLSKSAEQEHRTLVYLHMAAPGMCPWAASHPGASTPLLHHL